MSTEKKETSNAQKQIVSMSKQQISTSSPFFKGENVMALKIDQDYPNSDSLKSLGE